MLMQESGFSFADIDGGLKLAGVGTRVKKIGPVGVKVYAAGLYLDKYSAVNACASLKSKSMKEASATIGSSVSHIYSRMTTNISNTFYKRLFKGNLTNPLC